MIDTEHSVIGLCRVIAHLVAGLRDQDVDEIIRSATAAHQAVFCRQTPDC